MMKMVEAIQVLGRGTVGCAEDGGGYTVLRKGTMGIPRKMWRTGQQGLGMLGVGEEVVLSQAS